MEEITRDLVELTFWLVIVTFFAAITALIISIWGDWLKSLIFRPKLQIQYEHTGPDAIKIPLNWNKAIPPDKVEEQATAVSYYFRFRIKNRGNIAANNVEVQVTKIEKQNLDKSFGKYKPFIPLNLGWSNSNQNSFIPLIQASQEKHCDLGYILHPQQKQINDMIEFSETGKSVDDSPSENRFTLSFVVKPNIVESYNLFPGVYRIGIVVFASNAKKSTSVFELSLNKNWNDDKDEMLSQGVGLKLS